MVEKTVVEILNPLATSGNTTYVEQTPDGVLHSLGTCGIAFSCKTNFSLTNPEYTSSIFLSYFPEFTKLISGDNPPYLDLFNSYAKMANCTLNAKRFGECTWDFLMSAFIAHYMALTFLRISYINTASVSGDDIPSTISAISNQQVGLHSKESLGGEEVEIENMVNVGINKDAGEFMTTPYGRAFWNTYISYAKNFFRGVY